MVWEKSGTNKNLSHLWTSVNDIRLLKTQSKYKLQHDYIRDWFGEIGNVDRHPILRTYAIFKTKFSQENYIEFLSNKKYQRTISCFRVSSRRLGIETGRHEKPRVPPELRLCKYCESEAVDDELHFFYQLWFSFKSRQILFSVLGVNTDNFYSLTDIDKFKEILTSQRHEVILALGNFSMMALSHVIEFTFKLVNKFGLCWFSYYISEGYSNQFYWKFTIEINIYVYARLILHVFFFIFLDHRHILLILMLQTASFDYTGTVCNDTFLSCNLTLF